MNKKIYTQWLNQMGGITWQYNQYDFNLNCFFTISSL